MGLRCPEKMDTHSYETCRLPPPEKKLVLIMRCCTVVFDPAAQMYTTTCSLVQ
jgi:hypothetical protein